jgi:hypothetical protein
MLDFLRLLETWQKSRKGGGTYSLIIISIVNYNRGRKPWLTIDAVPAHGVPGASAEKLSPNDGHVDQLVMLSIQALILYIKNTSDPLLFQCVSEHTGLYVLCRGEVVESCLRIHAAWWTRRLPIGCWAGIDAARKNPVGCLVMLCTVVHRLQRLCAIN